MKKFLKMISVVALVLGGFIFSGCDPELNEALGGPTNTWCMTPIAYKHTDSGNVANLRAYFYYATSDRKIGNVNLQKGLNLVITTNGSGETIFSALTSTTYYLKSFGEKETISEEDGSININGSRSKWSAIYWAKDDLRRNKGVEPTQIRNGVPVNPDALRDFSLKRLLANYLLSILDE